jgi:hypothetical protein
MARSTASPRRSPNSTGRRSPLPRRTAALVPELYGRYLYSDFCGGRLRSLAPPPLVGGVRPAAGRVVDDRDEGLYVRYPTSFGEGLAGQIYIASRAGPVYRLLARAGGGPALP